MIIKETLPDPFPNGGTKLSSYIHTLRNLYSGSSSYFWTYYFGARVFGRTDLQADQVIPCLIRTYRHRQNRVGSSRNSCFQSVVTNTNWQYLNTFINTVTFSAFKYYLNTKYTVQQLNTLNTYRHYLNTW